jgi:hypothetical protein
MLNLADTEDPQNLLEPKQAASTVDQLEPKDQNQDSPH